MCTSLSQRSGVIVFEIHEINFHSIHTRGSDHLQSFDDIFVVLRHGKSSIFSMIVYLLEEGILVKNPWRNR